MAQDFTLEDLSKITGRHHETLRRLAREGQIPGMYRLGRHWLIARENAARLRRLPVRGGGDE